MSRYFEEENEHAEECNWIYGNCDCWLNDPEVSENDRIMHLLEKYN